MMLHAAIDMSGKYTCFTVKNLSSDEIVIPDIYFESTGNKGKSPIGFIDKFCKDNNVNLQNIRYWSVGTGPGSYTGLRSAAAFVTGVTFAGKDVYSRGLPTAFALAYEVESESGDHIAVLYPGRRNDLLVCFVKIEVPQEIFTSEKESVVFTDAGEAVNKLSSCRICVSLRENQEKIENFFYDTAFDIKNVHFTDNIKISNLFSLNRNFWDRESLKQLQYIRPAVYSNPRKK